MTNKQYLISICMIVKDEEKNIARCLESLKLLLDRENTELIIVDTGSTDRTVDIVKQYTSKVYFHAWNNSFSDMRNISISYAKGEWIFIIDADEELIDCEKLMELMSSDAVQHCQTIQLQARNILSFQVDRAVYHVTERLFRNTGLFKYVGTVHNQAVFQHPVLSTEIFINHYGYINEDQDLMEKKFKRTSALLLKELEENPEHVYYRFQLARTYMMHKDDKEAIAEIRKAYMTIKERKLKPVEYYYVYGEYVRLAICNNEYDEAIKIGLEGIDAKPDYIDVYYFTACSLFASNKKKDAIPLFESYFEMHANYTSGKMDLTKYNAVELYTIDSAARSNGAYLVTSYYCEIEDYEKASEYVNLIDEHSDKYKLLIKIYGNLGNYDKLLEYYNTTIEKPESKLVFVQFLEAFKNGLELTEQELIAKVFATGNGDYNRLNEIRIHSKPALLIKSFLKETNLNQLPVYPYYEIFKHAITNEIPLLPYLKEMETAKIKVHIKSLIDGFSSIKDELIKYLMTHKVRHNDFQSNRVFSAIANVIILSEVEDSNKSTSEKFIERIYPLFLKYIEYGMNYITHLYHLNSIRIIYRTLDDPEHKLLIIMYLAEEAKKRGDMRSVLASYGEAGEIYPYIAGLLNMMVVDYTNKISKIEILSSMDKLDINNVVSINGDETFCASLKVLHGTIEIANQMNTLVSGLGELGVQAKSLNYSPTYLGYASDYVYDLTRFGAKYYHETKEITLKAIEKFDVFHFHFGQSLEMDLSDLALLKESGKKVFMHHWGSDVRRYSLAKQNSKYVKVKNLDEEGIKRRLDYLSHYIEDCIVGDYELYGYVKDFYKNVHIIRPAIDLRNYICCSNQDPKENDKLLIVHAPTSPEIKGTKYILQAIDKLKQKYVFDFTLIQNMSHDSAKLLYQQADIIIDQILIGSHGLLAVEAMAMGKPVITWISDNLINKYPKELPIISANPDTIETVIEKLINNKELRINAGLKGRNYAESYHDVNKISKELLTIYTK